MDEHDITKHQPFRTIGGIWTNRTDNYGS